MTLPVPVRSPTSAGAFRFVDLEPVGGFFRDLERCIPEPVTSDIELGDDEDGLIAVQKVGAYEASFVPGRADFARLDARFVIPASIWDALPQYSGWSFAVFRLRPGAAKVHPMAFVFDTASDRLFFPTLHLHGPTLERTARFDHVLYAQGLAPKPGHPPRPSWEELGDDDDWYPPVNAEGWTHGVEQVRNLLDPGLLTLVDGDEVMFRRRMVGIFDNADVWATASATGPVEPPSRVERVAASSFDDTTDEFAI